MEMGGKNRCVVNERGWPHCIGDIAKQFMCERGEAQVLSYFSLGIRIRIELGTKEM